MSIEPEQKINLLVLASHPIQYQTPFYKLLAKQEEINLKVLFCSDWGLKEYRDKGFGKKIKWDTHLLDGYKYGFLPNISPFPNPSTFWGLINPKIIEKLKTESHNILWIHGWAHCTNWLAIYAAKKYNIPVLLRSETNLLPKLPLWKSIIKKKILSGLFNKLNGFLAIGKYNEDFYKNYGVPEEKIFSVPYVVNNDFFISKAQELISKKEELKKKFNIPLNCPVILYSGKLIDAKQPILLLKAYKEILKNNNAILVFLGDGALREELKSYANNLQNVYFMGFRNQTELPEFYTIADIFVLPSKHEPWGLVVNEAMCFSLPIIISDKVGASGDLVKEGVNGFVFPHNDLNRLVENLNTLVSDADLRIEMGTKSFEMISQWSYKEGVEGVLRCLKSHS